jgi:PPK2 family polyphosphate:nucleotide phosphotransferase
LAKVKEEKEVTKYDVDTGKPYTRKEVSFSLVLGQKPITEQAIEHLQDHGRLHVETGPLRAKAAATSPAILAVEVARMSCGYDKARRGEIAQFTGISSPYEAPTAPELEHDYLWRIHDKVPGNGEIAIFNRSHYEEVLVVRVQELAPEKVWRKRYRHIVEFERMLADEGTLVLKFFLHISKDEQKKRLQQRLEEKRKNWKWDPGDLRDRSYWDKYWEAYEEALERSSSDEAPWFVVPSDKKWWRDYVVSLAVVEALEALKMEYPKPKVDVKTIRID